MERETTVHLSDLDLALVLMTKVADLYSRLDEKQKTTLLQILVKRLIVDGDGQIVDHILNSPFVYLRSLVDVVCDSVDGKEGTVETDRRHSEDVESFLAGLQFEQRGKFEELRV